MLQILAQLQRNPENENLCKQLQVGLIENLGHMNAQLKYEGEKMARLEFERRSLMSDLENARKASGASTSSSSPASGPSPAEENKKLKEENKKLKDDLRQQGQNAYDLNIKYQKMIQEKAAAPAQNSPGLQTLLLRLLLSLF